MRLPGVNAGGYSFSTYVVAGFAADPSAPGTLYAEGYSGIHSDIESFFLKSTDYGATWTDVRFTPFYTLGDSGALAIGTRGTVYVSVHGIAERLFRSDDGGRHWQTVGTGLPTTNGPYGISAIVADPRRPGALYAVVDGLVFASTDSGEHFHAQSHGLPVGDLRTLVIDPHRDRLFAGIANEGIFVWDRGTPRWKRLDSGLPALNGVYGERFRGTLALDSTHGWLFASTYRGIYRLAL
jgi:hypothetical protein